MNLFQKRRERFAYGLIFPGVVLLLVVVFMPFIRNVFYSFTNYSLMKINPEYVGIENYIEILTGDDFFNAVRTSFIYVVVVITLIAVIGVGAAFIQNSKSIKGVTVLQIFLLLPWILPEVITGYIWKLLLNYQTGPYYRLLETLHIIPEGEDIFSNAVLALLAVAMANVWRGFPVVAITVYAKLQTLQNEQVEAAIIDGANRFQVFRFIEMPHVATSLISVLTLCFVWTFNAFGLVDVMTGGGPAGATETLPLFLQREAFQFFNYAEASAFAILMVILLVAIVLLLNAIPIVITKMKERR